MRRLDMKKPINPEIPDNQIVPRVNWFREQVIRNLVVTEEYNNIKEYLMSQFESIQVGPSGTIAPLDGTIIRTWKYIAVTFSKKETTEQKKIRTEVCKQSLIPPGVYTVGTLNIDEVILTSKKGVEYRVWAGQSYRPCGIDWREFRKRDKKLKEQ